MRIPGLPLGASADVHFTDGTVGTLMIDEYNLWGVICTETEDRAPDTDVGDYVDVAVLFIPYSSIKYIRSTIDSENAAMS